MEKVKDYLKEKHRLEENQLLSNKRLRYKELLGEDCTFIERLLLDTKISPWDVKALLDKGCPQELIPELLLEG